jgi:hypothetical protein
MTFILQMRIVITKSSAKPGNSCKSLFMTLEILPLPSEYIIIVKYILKQIQVYTVVIQGTGAICTEQLPSLMLSKKCYCSRIKILNSVSYSLKSLMNKKI